MSERFWSVAQPRLIVFLHYRRAIEWLSDFVKLGQRLAHLGWLAIWVLLMCPGSGVKVHFLQRRKIYIRFSGEYRRLLCIFPEM